MKNSDLIKQIKNLKNIEPDQYFSSNLRRRLILVSPSSQISSLFSKLFSNNLRLSLGFSLAVIIGLIVLTIINFRGAYLPYLASLDKDKLNDEQTNSDINIYLSEISYWQETEKQIGLALNQISQERSNSLNTKLLEKESQLIEKKVDSYRIEENEIRNPKINELLDSLL